MSLLKQSCIKQVKLAKKQQNGQVDDDSHDGHERHDAGEKVQKQQI